MKYFVEVRDCNLSRAQHRVELWKDEKDGGRGKWWNYSIAQNHYNLHVEHQNDRWGFGTFLFFSCCWVHDGFLISKTYCFSSLFWIHVYQICIHFTQFWTSTQPSPQRHIEYYFAELLNVPCWLFMHQWTFPLGVNPFWPLFFRSNDTQKNQQRHGISKFFPCCLPKICLLLLIQSMLDSCRLEPDV